MAEEAGSQVDFIRKVSLGEMPRAAPKHLDALLQWLAGRSNEAAESISRAFAACNVTPETARLRTLLYLDHTLFSHLDDPHQLFGLTPDCDFASIRERHKWLLQVFHPDRHMGDKDWFTQRSEQINQAFSRLKIDHRKTCPDSGASTIRQRQVSSPGPGPQEQTRRGPDQWWYLVGNKGRLRRQLKTRLGTAASLERRLYMAIFLFPAILLMLLYVVQTGVRDPEIRAAAVERSFDEGSDGDGLTGTKISSKPLDLQDKVLRKQHQESGDLAYANERKDMPVVPNFDSESSWEETGGIPGEQELYISPPIAVDSIKAPGAILADSPVQELDGSGVEEIEAVEIPSKIVTASAGQELGASEAEEVEAVAAPAEVMRDSMVQEISESLAATTITLMPLSKALPRSTEPTSTDHNDLSTSDTPKADVASVHQETVKTVKQVSDSRQIFTPRVSKNRSVATKIKTISEQVEGDVGSAIPGNDSPVRVSKTGKLNVSSSVKTTGQSNLVKAPENSATEQRTVASVPDDAGSKRWDNELTAIKALLDKYQSAYNASDIEGFSQLFNRNATSKHANSRSEIAEKYQSLFNRTRDRHLVLEAIHFERVGEHRYRVLTKYTVDWTYRDGKSKSSTDSFEMVLVRVGDEFQIWHLDD